MWIEAVVEREAGALCPLEQDPFAARKGFPDFTKALEALTKVVKDRPRDNEGCMGIARFLNASNQALTPVVKEKSAEKAKGPDAKGEKPEADQQ